MRIEIKPPSPAPSPPLTEGALVTLRVETADPAPLLSGPPTVAYEGRWAPRHTPAPAFLFPAPSPSNGAPGVSTAHPAASDFRTPPPSSLQPHVDIPLHAGDAVTATLTTPPPDNKTYSASFRAPHHPNQPPGPVALQLAEGAAAPPPPTPPAPTPADGLTITPLDEEGDVVRLDTAPGADNLIVLVPAP